jgi:hypothetical protein
VVENYNGVNDYIRFGKRGELASNRREEQELGMLCLHILQSSLGLVNTLMIQDTVALPEWEGVLTDADRRGLTPVFHASMTPYGEIQLRTDRRLDLADIPTDEAARRASCGRHTRLCTGSPLAARCAAPSCLRRRPAGPIMSVITARYRFTARLPWRRRRRFLCVCARAAARSVTAAARTSRSPMTLARLIQDCIGAGPIAGW